MKLLVIIVITGVIIHDIIVLHQNKPKISISNDALKYFDEHTKAIETTKE